MFINASPSFCLESDSIPEPDFRKFLGNNLEKDDLVFVSQFPDYNLTQFLEKSSAMTLSPKGDIILTV